MAVSIGGYLGFVPVMAGVFGSDKPQDLGVVASQTALGGDAVFTSIANHIINSVDGLNVDQVDFTGGQLNFTDTAPTRIQVWQP